MGAIGISGKSSLTPMGGLELEVDEVERGEAAEDEHAGEEQSGQTGLHRDAAEARRGLVAQHGADQIGPACSHPQALDPERRGVDAPPARTGTRRSACRARSPATATASGRAPGPGTRSRGRTAIPDWSGRTSRRLAAARASGGRASWASGGRRRSAPPRAGRRDTRPTGRSSSWPRATDPPSACVTIMPTAYAHVVASRPRHAVGLNRARDACTPWGGTRNRGTRSRAKCSSAARNRSGPSPGTGDRSS